MVSITFILYARRSSLLSLRFHTCIYVRSLGRGLDVDSYHCVCVMERIRTEKEAKRERKFIFFACLTSFPTSRFFSYTPYIPSMTKTHQCQKIITEAKTGCLKSNKGLRFDREGM